MAATLLGRRASNAVSHGRLGDRERPDYSTLAEGLSAQPTRIPRRRPILN